MKAVLHGLGMLTVVVVTAVCVLVQVDHVDRALDVISSRVAVAE
jgi:hypothetical protein